MLVCAICAEFRATSIAIISFSLYLVLLHLTRSLSRSPGSEDNLVVFVHIPVQISMYCWEHLQGFKDTPALGRGRGEDGLLWRMFSAFF